LIAAVFDDVDAVTESGYDPWVGSGRGLTPPMAQPDKNAILHFIQRADALGSPRFVATTGEGVPASNPFYRRA